MSSDKSRVTAIKQKRILKELKDIQENPIDPDNNIFEASPGCYVFINELDITNHKIMIIGPEGTPYENGFYMFDYNYSKNHPFEAPSVKFLTTDGTVRFNPNLYTNGKVCLSILGTWSGPGWEPTMSLRVVCEYLRSILNENPIQNEPGFENCVDTQCKMYNNYVTSENYELAILKHLHNLPTSLMPFYKTIILKFIENYDKIINKLNQLEYIDKHLGKTIGPYHKTLRFSIERSKFDIMLKFMTIYHCWKKDLFKEEPIFKKDLIVNVFNQNKKFILTEIIKLSIENIDVNPQNEFTPPQLLASIYLKIKKNKDKINNFSQLKKIIVSNYDIYNKDITFSDFVKLDSNNHLDKLDFDLILNLILMNIDSKILPKNIKIYTSKNYISSIPTNEIININELYN